MKYEDSIKVLEKYLDKETLETMTMDLMINGEPANPMKFTDYLKVLLEKNPDITEKKLGEWFEEFSGIKEKK